MLNLSLEKYGAKLHLNEDSYIDYSKPIVIDVETDGKDNFVGLGYTQDGRNIYYVTFWPKWDWAKLKVVGHNVKFDMHQLINWGADLTSANIYGDTMIMSYVYDTTAITHSLKPTAERLLGIKWCSYDEMVAQETDEFKQYKEGIATAILSRAEKLTLHSVKKAIKDGAPEGIRYLWDKYKSKECTLNFHPVENVAQYCGHDVLATHRLFRQFYTCMPLEQRRIYNTVEMPTLRILFTMERSGIKVNTDELMRLRNEFGGRVEALKIKINELCGTEVNPSSTKQIAPILEQRGLVCPVTRKGNKSVNKGFLAKHKGIPLVDSLLEYSEVEKLYNTYLDGFLSIPTLPRIHSTFNQVRYNDTEDEWEGMSTNRLSSSNPNMQNIPKRGTYAKLIRQLFIPKDDHVFIVGDYSQIEYRLLAHFSQDPTLLSAFNTGKDLHEEVAKALNCSREAAKQINYATIYGAQAPKVAELAKISEEEADTLLRKHAERFPNVVYWKANILYRARCHSGVRTMLNRFIPLPGIHSRDRWERMRAERQAINYVIQGSAAEVIKLAMIECAKWGDPYNPILQVHDELIFEIPKDFEPENVLKVIKFKMENVIKISVPIDVDIHVGDSWAEAKK